MKGDAYEGGHRVPFIVRYPGKVKAGTISNVTTTLANLMSTCADLVGDQSGKFESEDSYSIFPVLTGKTDIVTNQPGVVLSSSKGFFAVRKGSWKLITKLGSGGFTVPVELEGNPGDASGQLYNLDADIHEDNNLYNQYPEKVKELTDLLEEIKNAKQRLLK
jgi:arylsulfatase A-like enzyme